MPKFIKTLFLALLFVSGSAFAEWQYIVSNPQGDTFYIDPAKIRKEGNMRTMWIKGEYKIREKNVMSVRTKEEIDCNKEASRTLAFASFTEQNLMGEILTRGDYPNSSFSAIAPETLMSVFMQRVCN